jgi:hypothetical protein
MLLLFFTEIEWFILKKIFQKKSDLASIIKTQTIILKLIQPFLIPPLLCFLKIHKNWQINLGKFSQKIFYTIWKFNKLIGKTKEILNNKFLKIP